MADSGAQRGQSDPLDRLRAMREAAETYDGHPFQKGVAGVAGCALCGLPRLLHEPADAFPDGRLAELEAEYERGMDLAIEAGYIEQRDGMVRLKPEGKAAMIEAAGADPGDDPVLIALAMAAWFRSLIEAES